MQELRWPAWAVASLGRAPERGQEDATGRAPQTPWWWLGPQVRALQVGLQHHPGGRKDGASRSRGFEETPVRDPEAALSWRGGCLGCICS